MFIYYKPMLLTLDQYCNIICNTICNQGNTFSSWKVFYEDAILTL